MCWVCYYINIYYTSNILSIMPALNSELVMQAHIIFCRCMATLTFVDFIHTQLYCLTGKNGTSAVWSALSVCTIYIYTYVCISTEIAIIFMAFGVCRFKKV